MTTRVTLTEHESQMCTWVGKQRYAAATRGNHDPGAGPSRDDHTPLNHIRGAQCEYAASIMLNLFWRPQIWTKGRERAPDIGNMVEVRSALKTHHSLIVKPEDKDLPFVLVYKNGLDFAFYGWMPARQAKTWPIETRYGDAAHFVPPSALDNFHSLKQALSRAWEGRRLALVT